MQRNIIAKRGLILIAGAVLGGITACAPPHPSLNLFPASVLTEFTLQDNEAPPGYALITNTHLLSRAGLSQNPDYLTRRSDLEDVIQMDGAAAFLALYGTGKPVRLMVKGVYFREPQQAEKYATVQGTRQRQVMAYRRETAGGIWLLFVACDPDLIYDQTELRAIRQGLERYRKRLALSPIFDQMNADHAK